MVRYFFSENKYDYSIGYYTPFEWFELFEHGFVFSSGLPASSYFLITGVHGGHVLIGLLIIIFLLLRTSGKQPVREHSAGIEYFGLYWHFVDIVWVFLFPIFYLI